MEAKKVLITLIIVVLLIVLCVVAYLYITKEKPDPVSTQCTFACESGQKTSFCLVELKLKNDLTATCEELSKDSQYLEYKVQQCPSISCTVSAEEAAHLADQTCITGLGGKWETPVNDKCPLTGEEMTWKLIPSDNPPITGQICCG
ncbi:MAG: hypothetical protein NTW17_03315 [Candidatus Pacearchaeota archaeon]|nr:hypothetical protein [Candidatus Pacearchaeota archaeon]